MCLEIYRYSNLEDFIITEQSDYLYSFYVNEMVENLHNILTEITISRLNTEGYIPYQSGQSFDELDAIIVEETEASQAEYLEVFVTSVSRDNSLYVIFGLL